jgi:predicted deacylase
MVALPATGLDDPHPRTRIVDHTDFLAGHAGLLRRYINAGDVVSPGQLIATISDLAGEILEEIRAPREATVAIVRVFSSVHPGERVAQLFWDQ